MSDNLFDVPEVLSPKLAWLKKHKLQLLCQPTHWICHNPGFTWSAAGETQDEAILAYCARYGLKHWTLE